MTWIYEYGAMLESQWHSKTAVPAEKPVPDHNSANHKHTCTSLSSNQGFHVKRPGIDSRSHGSVCQFVTFSSYTWLQTSLGHVWIRRVQVSIMRLQLWLSFSCPVMELTLYQLSSFAGYSGTLTVLLQMWNWQSGSQSGMSKCWHHSQYNSDFKSP